MRSRRSFVAPCAGLVLLAGLLAGVSDAAARESLAPAAGRFLVARPGMADPRFRRTVILLVRHGAHGAIGLVVNRSTPLTLAEAFPRLAEVQGIDQPLWLGGPVEQERPALLVDAPEPPPGSLAVVDSVYFSRSVELLKSLAPTGALRFRVYAGYAGWAPGQLEGELARDAWTVVPASVRHIFSSAEEDLWRELDAVSSGTWVRRWPHILRAVRAPLPPVSAWPVDAAQRGRPSRPPGGAPGLRGRRIPGSRQAVGPGPVG